LRYCLLVIPMVDSTEIRSRIRSFVFKEFPIARKRGVKDDDPLLENGIIDSLGVLDVVRFLEQAFAISIDDEELTPDNFDSLEHLTCFVQKKRTGVQTTAV